MVARSEPSADDPARGPAGQPADEDAGGPTGVTTTVATHDPWTTFGLGVLGGVIAGLSLPSFAGIFLVGIVAIIAGIRVGPRPFGAAGVLLGMGVTWIEVFWQAQTSCDDPTSNGCIPPDMRPWFAIAAAILVAGTVLLALGIRRARHA